MSWLFPLYLLGAGAILAPILMHLRRRPPQERVEFSSLMFLQARTPQPTRKRRIEHWLLLLLRCLALLLLALMFSRPWLQSDARTAAGDGKAVLILVDRSASMRRADLMTQAVARARAEVQAANPQDRVALAAFDATLQPLWTFEQDAGASGRAGLLQQLDGLRPGWQATDLGRSLVDALGLLAGSSGMAGREQRLVIITDLQEGTRLDALRGVAWPEPVRVKLLRVEAPEAGNFSLSLAAAEPEAASAQPSLRVRVANTRETSAGDFTLRWEKTGGEVVTGQVPAGTTRLLRMPLPDKLPPEGDTLRLEGDAEDFDNRVFFAPAPPRPVRVAWLGPTTGADEAASPLYYLRRALQPTPALQPEVVQNGAAGLAGARLAVLHGAPPPAELGDWLRAGGFGVWLLDGTAAAAIETLTGVPGWTVTEAPGDGYRMLGEVKAEHALLRPFADPRLRDFTKLRFWKHRRVTLSGEAAPRVEVLARFDNGDPALLALPVGAGTLVLLTSGWQPADSQLALSTKFVPLLFGWLEAAGFAHAEAAGLSVGDALPPVETATTVVTPEGREIALAPGALHRTESVGLHHLKTGPGNRWHAVQLAPAEGRTSPMAVERLADFGVRLEAAGTATEVAAAAQVQERLAAGEAEERQQAWWWILVALLAVLGAETLLAARSARPERSAVVPT